MKRTILVFGTIAGLVVATIMTVSMAVSACHSGNDTSMEMSMLVGYASMLLAFAFVFVGLKNYRDKYNNGLLTFGQGFKAGILISLIASTFYVVAWLIEYYGFMPDFMDKYVEHVIKEAKDSGASAEKLAEVTKEAMSQKEMYKNPIYVILFTYFEILPVGVVMTLVAALVMRRKPQVVA